MIQLYKPWTFIKYLWILKQDSTTSDLLGMGNKIGFFLLFFLLLLFLVLWSFFAVYLLFMFVPIIFPTTSEHKSRGYLIALPKEKKVGMPKHTDFLHSSCFTKSMLFRLTNWVKFSRQFFNKMKFIYILTSEFKKIKINGKWKQPHQALRSYFTFNCFVFCSISSQQVRMKEEKEILEHFAGVVSVFFLVIAYIHCLLSVSVKSMVRSLHFTLPFLLLCVHV